MKLLRSLASLVLLLQAGGIFAQVPSDGYADPGSCRNLVFNPSFEIINPVVNAPFCYSNLHRAYGWTEPLVGALNHAGNPDLYYLGQLPPGGSSDCELCAVTAGDYAVEMVSAPPGWGKTTNAYAGLGLYSKRAGYPELDPEYREYILTTLRQPLRPGVTYNISMRLSLGEVSLHAMPLQVYFTNSSVFYSTGPGGPVFPNNGIEGLKTFSTTVTSKNGWTTVTAQITPPAGSDYQYMVIGNFRTDAQTEAVFTNVPATPASNSFTNKMSWSSYYLVDDVAVTPDCPAQLYLGGCNTQGYFNSDSPVEPFFPQNPESFSSLQALITANITSIYIDYPILVNIDYNFTDKELIFGPQGKLIVASGKKLTLKNCNLHGCQEMWPGLEVQPGGKLELHTSTISDALLAVRTNNAAQFSIIGNTFDRNLQHVSIENHSTIGLRDMYANSFKCTGNLKHPHTGYQTTTAVSFLNCTATMKFGIDLSTLNGNTVTQATTGLNILSSNIEVYKNTFNNIYGTTNNAWAIRAQHTGLVGNYRKVQVGGPGKDHKNNIYFCRNGVYMSGNHKGIVENNQLNNIEQKGIELVNGVQPGRSTTTPQDADFMVLDNYIYNTLWGIRFYNNGNARIKAYRNKLAYLTTSPPKSSIGIYIGEVAPLAGTCRFFDSPYNTKEKLILENTIQRYAQGVLAENASCAWIRSNTIALSAPITDQHHGIWYRNGASGFVYKNKVTGNRLGWQTLGIRVESSNSNECGCNNITKNGYAQINAGWQTLNRIYNNRLDNTQQGITVWGGGVGKQIPGYLGANEWYNVQSVNGSQRHFWADASYQSQHSRFYLPTVSGIPQNPPAFSIAGSGTAISTQAISYSPLSRCDKDAPTVLKSMAILEEEIRDGIMPQHEGHKLLHTLALLTDIADNNWEDSSKILHTFVKASEHEQQLVLAQKELAKPNYNGALALLNSFTPANNYETVYKDWLLLLASKGAQNAPFDDSDLSFLQATAALCELEYGAPVYSCRAIIANEFPDKKYNVPSCGEIRDNNPGSLEPEDNKPAEPDDFVLSPNPGKNMVNINNKTAGTADYTIRELLTGTLMMTGTVAPGNTSVSIPGWTPGNYSVLFTQPGSGTVLETDILVVLP